MISSVFCVFWLATASRAVPIDIDSFQNTIYVMQRLLIVPRGPTLPTDFAEFEALNLTSVPECPMSNRVFSCDANGKIVSLNLTQVRYPPNAYVLISDLTQTGLDKFELRGFVGDVRLRSIADEIRVFDSLFVSLTPDTLNTPFIFDAPVLILQNVSFPYYSPSKTIPLRSLTMCRFVNVTMRCPLPLWVEQCFPPGEVTPCITSWPPIRDTYGHSDDRCVERDHLCSITCSPPASGYGCPIEAYSYFPATPGFTTVTLVYPMFGEAENLNWRAFGTRGLLARLELWDWKTLNWSVVVDRAMWPREDLFASVYDSVALPPVLTNQARITFEQHYEPGDSIDSVALIAAKWPGRASPIKDTVRSCQSAKTFNARSMLDETIAESLCIGRVCQLACTSARSFEFDRSVLPLFIVIEDGERWSEGTLVNVTSLTTRVYSLNSSTTGTAFVNVTGVGDVSRVMLVGNPLEGQQLPTVVLPTRKGLPGVFARFRWQTSSFPGGTIVPDATSMFDGRSMTPPFTLDRFTSIAVVRNQTFAVANGTLYRFRDDSWQNVANAMLTPYILNRAAAQPPRKLVAVDDRLLVVVSGLAVIHDGYLDRRFINRWLNQSAIDVLDVVADAWFTGLLRHDVRLNISDVDVVAWNSTTFGIVPRSPSLAASVVEFRPFGFDLVQCSANTECSTCITNEANIEPCRWCGLRCAALCTGLEVATINASRCEMTTETSSTATTSAASTTSSTVTTTSDGAVDSSTVETSATTVSTSTQQSVADTTDAGLSLGATIGLAVGVPLAVLAIVGIVCGVIWFSRRQKKASSGGEAPKAVHMDQLPHKESFAAEPNRAYDRVSSYDDVESVRPVIVARPPEEDENDTETADESKDEDDTDDSNDDGNDEDDTNEEESS
jgi:hypothetical protein